MIEIAATVAPNQSKVLRRQRDATKRREQQNQVLEGLIGQLAHLKL